MTEKTFDAIVIGGGPGGYVCAIRLGQLKQSVLCIEKEETLGGVCLNWGCIPSKALISVAHAYDKVLHGAPMGLKVTALSVDAEVMQDWKDGIVKKLTGGIRQLFKANGVESITGTARVRDAHRVEIVRPDGSVEEVTATKAIVVAVGAKTVEIPSMPFDGKQIIGAREAVSLRQVPKRLCVIGGGVIGLELGTVYQTLGSELVVVEALPQLLTGIEPECTQVVERRLLKRGARILKNARAQGVTHLEDGSLRLRVEVGDKTEVIDCDVLLVAVGMRPNGRSVGLEEIGVKVLETGAIATDEEGRTNIPSIFAIGDVCGAPLLAHKASKEGEVVAEVIAGHKAGKDWSTIPAAVFTDPEIASVGMTTEQAKASGYQVKTGKFPFAALGRAMAMGETDGFAKVVIDEKSRRLLGFHVVGPSASELIAEGTVALELGGVVDDVMLTIHTHPTLAEAMMEAAAASVGQAVHMVNR